MNDPTPAAMRAAREICRQNQELPTGRDIRIVAQLIDRETTLPELIAVCKSFVEIESEYNPCEYCRQLDQHSETCLVRKAQELLQKINHE